MAGAGATRLADRAGWIANAARREAIRHYSLTQALLDKRVLLLSLVYFGGTFAGYGIVLFQPQIVHRLAAGFGMTGVINAIPYAFAAVAMILWGHHSDRTGERPTHVAIAYSVGAIGLIATALMTDPVLTMATLVIAAMGQASTGPTFWSLPTAMLSGTAAAGGIALINALGNLGGFFGPYLFGLVKDATGGSFMFAPDGDRAGADHVGRDRPGTGARPEAGAYSGSRHCRGRVNGGDTREQLAAPHSWPYHPGVAAVGAMVSQVLPSTRRLPR